MMPAKVRSPNAGVRQTFNRYPPDLYLHWFDKQFHRTAGPAIWAKAKLVRYADDFVVLARYQTARLRSWIESQIEGWLGLEINREKTRVVNLAEAQASLDFLGYTFRWDRDLYGSGRRYLNVEPSKKSLQREREAINVLTDRRQACTPIPQLIAKLNRHLRGWANYFSYGYPRRAYRQINWHLGYRLANHLKHHRSQRPYRLPEGMTYYDISNGWASSFWAVPPATAADQGFQESRMREICTSGSTRGERHPVVLSYSTGQENLRRFPSQIRLFDWPPMNTDNFDWLTERVLGGLKRGLEYSGRRVPRESVTNARCCGNSVCVVSGPCRRLHSLSVTRGTPSESAGSRAALRLKRRRIRKALRPLPDRPAHGSPARWRCSPARRARSATPGRGADR